MAIYFPVHFNIVKETATFLYMAKSPQSSLLDGWFDVPKSEVNKNVKILHSKVLFWRRAGIWCAQIWSPKI